jgi:hypothetical protein
MYKSEKQNDNTYTIYFSKYGCNKEIVKTGVRGCNVNRIINRYYLEDLGLCDKK